MTAWRARQPELLLILMTFLWGSTFIVTKDIVRTVPPLNYVLLRYLLAGIVLLALHWRKLKPSRRLVWDGFVLGSSTALGLLVQVIGQVYTTASKSAFITALCTALTPLGALALHGEHPRRNQTIGVVLATVGLFFLTYPVGRAAWNPGDLLALASAFIYAYIIVETAYRSRHHAAIDLAAAQIIWSMLIFAFLYGITHIALACLPERHWPTVLALEHRSFTWNLKLALQLGYMAFFCTVVALFGQTWAMARMSATHAAVIFSLEPVFAVVLAVATEGASEWPGTKGAMGALLVLAGVLVAEVKLKTLKRQV